MRALRVPVHPFLFALFPLISLYAENRGILGPRTLVVPMACALLFAALLLVAGTLLLGDRRRAAAATSLIILSIFFYPTLMGALALVWLPSSDVCLALWAIWLLVGLWLIARTRSDLGPISTSLDAMALVALGIPLLGLAPTLWSTASASLRAHPAHPAVVAAAGRPDIYYIILDGYARQDVLAKYYDFDNREFVDGLRQRGFYVATESRSNYAQTYLSLASSLNQTYLDDVVQRMGEESDDRQPLADMIANSRAAEVLRRQGYTFVSFATGYTGTEIPDADVYIRASASLTEFQHLLFEFTPLSALSNLLVGGDVRYASHRNRILHTLDRLGQPIDAQRPFFVFAHIGAPHPPFVFGPSGEWVDRGETFSVRDGSENTPGGMPAYVARYRDQLTFLNGRVTQAIERILATVPSPIVILQGDHGPGSRLDDHDVTRTDHWERMSILNAYYFPDRRYERLYPSISPVNTFRLILSQYFGEHAPLLPDHSFSSLYRTPYAFVDVGQGPVEH